MDFASTQNVVNALKAEAAALRKLHAFLRGTLANIKVRCPRHRKNIWLPDIQSRVLNMFLQLVCLIWSAPAPLKRGGHCMVLDITCFGWRAHGVLL